jgi:hypothetical protein
VTLKSDVPSPWRDGQLLNLNYPRQWLLDRDVGRLDNSYRLPRNGHHFSTQVCSSKAIDPSENPITMRGQLRIPVESVKEAIRKWNPTAEFNKEEPLEIMRTSVTYMYTKRPLPGDIFTAAALTYDASSKQFAASVPDFAVWTGLLPKYKVPVIGSLCMSYTVDSEEFLCLKDQALSGRSLVLRPEDHASWIHPTRRVIR